ncbi:MAG: hypothetical protein ACRDD1_21710, partial [Planctomycetia bacterium]
GATWLAPPKTPAPDDPIHLTHPKPAVVAIDRKTRKRVRVDDPTAVLKRRAKTGADDGLLFVRPADGPR